jgi:hypothetical protein
MMNGGGNEVIHVGLGDVACRVSAHLHNLQGLAGTNNNNNNNNNHHNNNGSVESSPPLCHLSTTHSIYDQMYVPRSILIGNVVTAQRRRRRRRKSVIPSSSSPSSSQQQQQYSNPITSKTNNSSSTSSSSRHHHYDPQPSSSPNDDDDDDDRCPLYERFQVQATQLAYGPYSRYRVADRIPSTSAISRMPSSSYASTGRQVNWEEEEEVEDGSDTDAEIRRGYSREREDQQRKKEYRLLQDDMDQYWDTTTTTTTTDPNHLLVSTTDTSSVSPQHSPPQHSPFAVSWYDYLMLSPVHPHTCIETLYPSPPLEYNTDNNNDDLMAVSSSPPPLLLLQDTTGWIETTVWEPIRKLLEACDACQGLFLLEDTNDDHDAGGYSYGGIYTGWATALLQEWNDECPHACSWMIPLHTNSDNNDNDDDLHETTRRNNISQHQQRRSLVRKQIQQSWVLANQTGLSNIYLPIGLPSGTVPSATAAATVAMALECVTLPYRIATAAPASSSSLQQRTQLAWQTTTLHDAQMDRRMGLSYREFVRTMQRSSASRNVLELDTIVPSVTNNNNNNTTSSLLSCIQQGTSLERDQRMQQPGYRRSDDVRRPVDVAPGAWMNHVGNNVSGGLLSSLSPTLGRRPNIHANDRNLHYHYALSTSLRPTRYDPLLSSQTNYSTSGRTTSSSNSIVSNYVTGIMESMGIRYRPEQAICAVVDESLQRLITDGYGVGSYWRSIFHPKTQPSVLSVLGNTTRIYPYLYETAAQTQSILAPPRSSSRHQNQSRRRHRNSSSDRSFYQQDVQAGILPEQDDCMDAMAVCFDLRDSYEPPRGSGLVVDEEGEYFDTMG